MRKKLVILGCVMVGMGLLVAGLFFVAPWTHEDMACSRCGMDRVVVTVLGVTCYDATEDTELSRWYQGKRLPAHEHDWCYFSGDEHRWFGFGQVSHADSFGWFLGPLWYLWSLEESVDEQTFRRLADEHGRIGRDEAKIRAFLLNCARAWLAAQKLRGIPSVTKVSIVEPKGGEVFVLDGVRLSGIVILKDHLEEKVAKGCEAIEIRLPRRKLTRPEWDGAESALEIATRIGCRHIILNCSFAHAPVVPPRAHAVSYHRWWPLHVLADEAGAVDFGYEQDPAPSPSATQPTTAP